MNSTKKFSCGQKCWDLKQCCHRSYWLHPRLWPPFSYVIDLVNITEIDFAEIGKTGLFFGYLESNTLLNGTPALFSPAIWMASELRFGWFLNFCEGEATRHKRSSFAQFGWLFYWFLQHSFQLNVEHKVHRWIITTSITQYNALRMRNRVGLETCEESISLAACTSLNKVAKCCFGFFKLD